MSSGRTPKGREPKLGEVNLRAKRYQPSCHKGGEPCSGWSCMKRGSAFGLAAMLVAAVDALAAGEGFGAR